MIVDAETLDLVNAIETPARRCPDAGEVKPELHGVGARDLDGSVHRHARGRQRSCARCARRSASGRRARADDRLRRHAPVRDVGGPAHRRAATRYRDLISALRFVARQELIFGLHVHVGVDDPDKAIHVANGMRVHIPVLLALSVNSPFWRGDATGPGLHAHADLPRVPARGRAAALTPTGTTTRRRSTSWSSSGVIDDYTYLWYDVRTAPATSARSRSACATRRPASSTRSALAALIQAMVKELCRALRRRRARCPTYPWRCSTRTSGWPHATASTASSSTCRRRPVRDARRWPSACWTACAPHAAGPRLGRRARGRSTTCCAAAPAPRRQISSTRPTTICARSCARSCGDGRRATPAARTRQPGSATDRRASSTINRPCRRHPTSSSSARTAAPRCRASSPSARTAAAPAQARAEARGRRPVATPAARRARARGSAAAPRRDPRHPPRSLAPAGRGDRARDRLCRRRRSPPALSARRRRLVGPPDGEWWRVATAPFFAEDLWYVATCVSRSCCSARCSSAATARSPRCCSSRSAASAASPLPPARDVPLRGGRQRRGAGDDRRLGDAPAARHATRAGRRRRPIGAGIFAAVLLLMPLAVEEASATAGAAGLLVGILAGALLARRR